MIALDTNILARAIVHEAEADAVTQQQQTAAQALLTSGQTLFLPVTVVQELDWVLRGVYELPRDQVLSVIEDLLHIEHLVVDRAAAIAEAVEGYRQGLDFSDALHLAQSRHCDAMASFDARFRKRVVKLHMQPPVHIP
ncbi:type II toxin-antitoxin system VapC family toxin [Thiohalocapsa marina]|uniref:Type II toxin-antitoxin system VapC family toxin n=1 Tax=Thiohalocapsa marina TaxID=424902 RepID=A0A5M8FVE0_9GAMM|nr:type II toxin-antitoxin system VapC family toxin [Thiohalocapsa marina]KAA6187766.1 type II toxin-antitoxin system VapC family toxin [Thiohalocapsa marina]